MLNFIDKMRSMSINKILFFYKCRNIHLFMNIKCKEYSIESKHCIHECRE